MKIALVSKLWEATSPLSTGGTGMSVGMLADELVAKGHKVTVFGTGNSKTRANLVSVQKTPWKQNYSEPIEYLNIAEAFSSKYSFDIIHAHVEHKAAYFADIKKDTPHLMSIRYGEFFEHEKIILKRYSHLNWSANSVALANLFPYLNFAGVVYNGLDLKRYPMKKKGKYLLFLSRLSPQKGPEIAIAVAKKLGIPLILAGKTNEEDKEFLEKKVFPNIDGKRIKYVGEVGFKEKIKLLQESICLLHPNQYFEACSNSILEAQACGVPVVAYDNGSNGEIVIDGITGFIVKNELQFQKAISKIEKIDSSLCRKNMEANFTASKMTDGYINLYKKIIKAKKI